MTSYFVLTKIEFQIMELMFQFLIFYGDHNIIFGKVNIRVLLPLAYIRKVWNYSQTNLENIKYAISYLNWSKTFENLSVDGQVKHLNETLLNIF